MTLTARTLILVLLFGMGFVIPLFVRAQTQSEIQQQIIDLLSRLDDLQKQIGTQPTNPPTLGGQTGAGSSVLSGGLTLSRDLQRGMSGSDVSSLQSFLARDTSIYPSGQATGFFGPLTETAVQRFQVSCGIVAAGDYKSTGYGRVGPRTRTALSTGCNGIPQGIVGGFMRVSPTTGPAPLAVTIAVTANSARSCEYSTYEVDFGDRTQPARIIVPAGRCAELDQSVPHTYQQPGNYTITLRSGTHYATTQITVGGTGGVAPPTGTQGQGSALPSFTYQGRTFTLGSQEISGPLSLFEYPLAGQPITQWTELMTFGRDRTLGGYATLADLDGAAEQTLNIMRDNGATVYKTFTHRDRRDANKIYNVIVMAFQIPGYVELDIRKMLIYNGEIISITNGQKVPLSGSTSAQQIMNNFFAQTDANGLVFVETDFYLPWLVTYTGVPPPTTQPPVANVDPQLSLTPGFEGDIRRVQVRFTLSNSCSAFTLNWGDGSASESRGQGSSGCSSSNDVRTYAHTYQGTSNATYVITLTYGPPGNQETRTASIVIGGQ